MHLKRIVQIGVMSAALVVGSGSAALANPGWGYGFGGDREYSQDFDYDRQDQDNLQYQDTGEINIYNWNDNSKDDHSRNTVFCFLLGICPV